MRQCLPWSPPQESSEASDLSLQSDASLFTLPDATLPHPSDPNPMLPLPKDDEVQDHSTYLDQILGPPPKQKTICPKGVIKIHLPEDVMMPS